MQSNGGRPAVSISEHLLAIPSWPSDLSTLRLTPKDIERTIKRLEDFLIDRIGELSFSSDEYEQLASLIGCYASLENGVKTKLLNAVISGMTKIANLFATDKQISSESLESASVLVCAIVSAAEKDRPAAVGTKRGKNEQLVDWNQMKVALAEGLKTICSSPTLPRVYQTNTDLENLVK
jgi:hypothetical protein